MRTILFSLLFFFAFQINAITIHVPADYTTIQEAINASTDGDIIIVANGTYVENIDFLGKAIIVASNYYTSLDNNDIVNTIIDGSAGDGTDFGSCVSFKNNEENSSVLQGFTLQNGSGTKTGNEGTYFRTGGGILIDYASPTIINNIIKNNECVATAGVSGAGGGGIRMGYGMPIIMNNIIKNNTGGYAGGIMIAYCSGAIIKNNVIANNTATGSFNGGGGVYVDWESITLENNSIVNNHSGDKGGGIISTGTSTVIINCIIYGNTATNGDAQIYKRYGGNAELTYTCIEGGFDGIGDETGMITDAPLFENTDNYLLTVASPCVDAGNPEALYNDIENIGVPGSALPPSLGTITNDMGAYGGNFEPHLKADFIIMKQDNTVDSLHCINTDVIFKSASVGFNPIYEWSFGEGANPPTANYKGPHTVVYSSTGHKTIKLKIIREYGADSIEYNILISGNTPGNIDEISGESEVLRATTHTYSVVEESDVYYNWISPFSYWTGSSITNEINITFGGFPATGNLEVFSYNGCGISNTQTLEITSVNELAVNEIEGLKILFENPYKNNGIIINSDISTDITIKVFDFTGKQLNVFKTVKINQGFNNVNLNINTNSLVVISNKQGKSIVLKMLK